MKKFLLSFCAAATLVASAGTTPGLEYSWGSLIDGPTSAGDQSTDIAIGKKGGIYWFGTYGSNDANGLDINYDGEFLFTGASYSGTSQNANFTLLKTDADGLKQWAVYSNSGDFASSQGGCAATSDGGVVIVSKVRHTDGFTDRNIALIDATGKQTAVEWTCERRYYRMMATKVSAEGAVVWNRMIDFSTEPGPGASGNYASFWADVFNVKKITVDDNDNIYIALNFRNPVSVPKADGSYETIVPSESSALTKWTGDPQSTLGDFLILGLDNSGYYRNKLAFEGTANCTYCDNLEFADGKIYAQGYAMGDGSTLKAGSHSFTPTSDGAYNPLLLRASTDLSVDWVKCFIGEKIGGKHGFQNTGITVTGNTLWLCGQYNLKITDPTDPSKSVTATQGTLREGFILKLDATDGSWIAARNSRDDDWNEPIAMAKTGLSGYFKVLQNAEKPEHIYVFGYVMNAAVGVFLRQYDATTLEGNLDEGQNNVVTQGGVPSCQSIAYDPESASAYFTVRGNKAFKPMNADETAAPTSWGILATRFKLPAEMKTTGIDAITGIADEDAPVEYYNLQGMRVENPANGIFIRRQGSKVSKIAL